MVFDKYIQKNVVIELKNGDKYFGILVAIDQEDELTWLTISKNNKRQTFCDTEIRRLEEQ